MNRKMKILQEYWASTVIFIGIFSQSRNSFCYVRQGIRSRIWLAAAKPNVK